MKCISNIWWCIVRSFQHSSNARSKRIIRWLVWHYHSLKKSFCLRDRTMIPHLNIKRLEIPYVSCYHQFLHFFLRTKQLSQLWKRAFLYYCAHIEARHMYLYLVSARPWCTSNLLCKNIFCNCAEYCAELSLI